LAAAKLGFGSHTQVWQLPNSGLAAAKLWFGSCQTRVWQLPNSGLAAGQPPESGLAAAELWFGSRQNRVWQRPNSGFGSWQTLVWQLGSRHTGVWQLPNSGFAATERPIIQNRYNLSIVCPAFFLRAETVHHKYVKTHRNVLKRHKQHDSNIHHKLKSI